MTDKAPVIIDIAGDGDVLAFEWHDRDAKGEFGFIIFDFLDCADAH